MLPVSRNISIYQGDTFTLKFRLRTKDENDTIEPVDLTGAAVRAEIRAKDSETLFATFGAEITVPLGGEVQLTLTPAQTTLLTTNGRWDVQVTFPNGVVRTYLKGSVSLKKQVSL